MKNYKKNSKKNFDKQAKIYDNSICSMYPKKCYSVVISELSKLKYQTLLDVGCGTGEILNSIASSKKEYYGLDLSEKMLEIARKKSKSKYIHYICGDSEKMPFDDNFFDVLICTESFHHYPNPRDVVKEFNRVLKPGGVIILCDMYRKAPLRWFYNFLMKIVNTGDVKIYTKNEILNIFDIPELKLIRYYYSTKQTFLVMFEKEEYCEKER